MPATAPGTFSGKLTRSPLFSINPHSFRSFCSTKSLVTSMNRNFAVIRSIDSLTSTLTDSLCIPSYGGPSSLTSNSLGELSELECLESKVYCSEMSLTSIADLLNLCKSMPSLPLSTATNCLSIREKGILGVTLCNQLSPIVPVWVRNK